MSEKRDCYEILGVAKSATAGRSQVGVPQIGAEMAPRPQSAGEARSGGKIPRSDGSVFGLSDPQKRAAYDRYGYAGLSRGGFDGGVNQTIFDEFQDIFGDFFWIRGYFSAAGVGGNRANRGADLRYDMKLSFEEAAAGVNTKIVFHAWSFAKSATARERRRARACGLCHLRWPRADALPAGILTISRTCPDCRGAGQIVRESCPDCRGKGRIERSRTIDLRIPPGVDSNTRLRVPGEGEPGGNGGPAGDLYVVLDVKPHPYFERRDADLYCTVPVFHCAGSAWDGNFSARAEWRRDGKNSRRDANRGDYPA